MTARNRASKRERLDVLRSLLGTPRRLVADRYSDRELLELQAEAERLADELGVEL